MSQEDDLPPPPWEEKPWSQEQPEQRAQENAHPFVGEAANEPPSYYMPGEAPSAPGSFQVTNQVEYSPYRPMVATPQRKAGLASGASLLVGLGIIGAAILCPLTIASVTSAQVPCTVPTPSGSTAAVPEGTPTARCTTSSGLHYLWIPSRGGWVASDDGVHPNEGATGSGADEGHGGIGEGAGGEGHGGGEGG